MGKLIFRSKTIVVKIGLIGVLILTTICVSLTVHARTDLPNQIKPQTKSVRVLYGKNEILPKPPITVHIEYHGKMKDYKVPQDTVENTLNRLHIQLGKDDVMGWELSDMITDDQTIVISFKEKTSSCPYCQKMKAEEDYAFGADFPSVANNDSFYIRKSIRANCFELVFEGEGVDNSCRISFCPFCGRKLK